MFSRGYVRREQRMIEGSVVAESHVFTKGKVVRLSEEIGRFFTSKGTKCVRLVLQGVVIRYSSC